MVPAEKIKTKKIMCKNLVNIRSFCGTRNRNLVFIGVSSSRSASESVSVLSSPSVLEIRLDIYHKSALNYDDLSVYSSGVLSLMKKDKMSKRKKAITDYFMQSKKLNKGEDSM